VRIGPQSGPQEQFLAASADIAIYGGAAGSGKTWAELLEPLRHVTTNKDFAAVFFRRTTVQIRNVGGLWDASMRLYPLVGASPTAHVLEWHWPEGGKVKMAHLEHESTVFDWQGSEIPLILFDELTHFTQNQFFYMLSRNRSMCGIKPYVRATCNPDADSWVAKFIAWWIDQETGFPIPERSGIVRWFIRLNDVVIWGDSREELVVKYGDAGLPAEDPSQPQPKSVTFVPGKLSDNPALMKADPGYLANLKALPVVEQARLLGGNWKIRPAAGLYFKRSWCEIVDVLPHDLEVVRYWDLAATEKTDSNDPDWTVGVKLGKSRATGVYYVADVRRDRLSPLGVELLIENTASLDDYAVTIGIPQDPGQAGKSQSQAFIRRMAKYTIRAFREAGQGDKIVRFGPFSAQAQGGNVKILRGAWNEDYFTALEAFPSSAHDDDVDGTSGAYRMLTNSNTGLLDYYREAAEKVEKERAASAGTNKASAFIQAFS
jgi:predicted phage terminase large subunit-like protein